MLELIDQLSIKQKIYTNVFLGPKSGNGEEIQPNLQTTCNIPPS